jgi:hypothetical protein
MMKLQGVSSVLGGSVATTNPKKNMPESTEKIKYVSTRQNANYNNDAVLSSYDSSPSLSIVSRSSIMSSFPTIIDCGEATKSESKRSSSLRLRRQQRTGVRFSTSVTVRLIRSCKDYKLQQEFDARWYTLQELQGMVQSCYDDDEFQSQARRKRYVRKLAYDALFDAQYQRQYDTPEQQEMILANLYQRYSSRCLVRAQLIGVNDQRAVKLCYNNNNLR